MQTKKVTIEIWSDIVCPFCWIGKKKMERAIAKLNAEGRVEVIWHSFQLDPEFPMEKSISTNEYLVQRKGYPQEQITMMTSQLVEQGLGYGIDFQFGKARSFNTLNAQRLIHWSKEDGKSNELKESLMLHYFTKGLDLSMTENLMSVVDHVGLDIVQAKQVLSSEAYIEEVKHDVYQSRQLGIRGVPYFLINEKITIAGAQHDQEFENSLTAALKDLELLGNSNQVGVCVPNEECK